jgi:hypothetical protein
MASKQTYECFVCKRNGYPETRVFLDGKDENGKTIYKNEDMSPHQHKQRQVQQQQQPPAAAVLPQQQQEPTLPTMKIISAKLDRIISLLETKQQAMNAN